MSTLSRTRVSTTIPYVKVSRTSPTVVFRSPPTSTFYKIFHHMSVFRLVSVDLTTIFIVRVKSKSTPLSSVCLSVTTNSLGSTYVVTSVVVTLI